MYGESPSSAALDRRGDVFSILASRPRLDILVALLESDSREEGWSHGSLSFSELHAAVEVKSTSQFAYHLDRLDGPFVAEAPEGYRLTLTGETIARAIVAGSLEPTSDFDPVVVDAPCPLCGARGLVAESPTDLFVLRCAGCDESVITDFLSESELADRTPREAVDCVGRRLVHFCRMAADGVCPECHGRLESSVESHERGGTAFYAFRNSCRQCWREVHVPVEVGCLVHPAAVALRWRDGGTTTGALWDLFEVVVEDCSLDVVSERPFEGRVTLRCGDEVQRFEVGEEFDVEAVVPDSG